MPVQGSSALIDVLAIRVLRAARFAGLIGLASNVSAQSTMVLDDVKIEVIKHWPDSLTRGWAPVQMRLQNDGVGGPEVVDLRFRTSSAEYSSTTALDATAAVEAGSVVDFERYVPCDVTGASGWMSQLQLLARAGSYSSSTNLDFSRTARPPEGRVIALLGRDELTEAALTALESKIPDPGQPVLRGLESRWNLRGPFWPFNRPHLHLQVPRSHTHPGGTKSTAALFTVPLRDLPKRPLAWTSVDTIIVFTNHELPDVPGWAPIWSWVRRGGQIVFVGTDAAERARDLDGFDELVSEDRRLDVVNEAGRSAYRVGFGTLATVEDASFPLGAPGSEPSTDAFAKALGTLDAGTPVGGPSALGQFYLESARAWPEPLSESRLPVRPVLAFLIVFSLIVGPGSVVLSRKWKRPDVLFLLVPAFSLGATVLIAGFGIAREGFGVHGNAHSLSLLDQENDRAVTALRREVFVGRSGFSLRPEPTSFVLVPSRNEAGLVRTIEDDGAQLDLGGGFLPVRANTTHLVLSDAPSRVELDVRTKPNGDVEVTNALGVDVEKLEIQSPDGVWFRTSELLGIGDTVTLAPMGTSRGETLDLPRREPVFTFAEAPRGGYRALVPKSPTADDCELPMTEDYGVHVVVGKLDDVAVGWNR